MKWLWVFFSFLSVLCANTIVTENDPSSLVNGVSVITGDLFDYRTDYQVQGKEPVYLDRAYLSSIGSWNPYPHLRAVFLVQSGKFYVTESNGTTLEYMQQNSKSPKKGPFRLDVLLNNAPGTTNTAKGIVSAHTNYKNQYLLIAKDGESFVLHKADGTKRHYQALKKQKKQDFGIAGKAYIDYWYQLDLEELPNGNQIKYAWNKDNCLTYIQTLTRRGKVLAGASIPAGNGQKSSSELTTHGTDGLSLTHTIEYFDREKKRKNLKSTNSPHSPVETISVTVKKNMPYLESVSLPNGKVLHIEYQQKPHSDLHWVKKLLSPIGQNGALEPAHTFSYYMNEKTTDVLDADGNRTAYFWNNDSRLTRIDYFVGNHELHHSEQFVWDGIQIRCKSFFDETRTPVFAKTFSYDDRGNVIEEAFYGNLSGEGAPLIIEGNGFPKENGVERQIKKMAYSNDGKNLLIWQEDSSGLVTVFSYVPNTNLIQTKFICDGVAAAAKIRHFYEYNEDLILVAEIIEDSISKKINRIIPQGSSPYYGMPEIIEEKYQQDGQELLLQKTVISYGNGGRPEKKEVFDANHIKQYTIHTQYNGKGNVTKLNNPLGWESTSQYDQNENQIYAKDFQGNEAFFAYDVCNRLVKKEIVGFDGIKRSFEYEYDRKSNPVLEIDEYGQKTESVFNSFGQKTETHLPPIQDSSGNQVSAVLRSKFNAMGNEIESVDAEGFTTKRKYNACGKPIWVQFPDLSIEEFRYFLDGSLRSHTDKMGVITQYKYDYLGRVLLKTVFENGGVLSQEEMEYSGQFLVAKINAEGSRTSFYYDKAGRKILEEVAGEETKYFYDSLSRNNVIESSSVRIIWKLDLLGRVEEEMQVDVATGILLRKTSYSYDKAGNKIETRSFVSEDTFHTEIANYDSKGRLNRKTDASGAKFICYYNDGFLNELGQKVLQKTQVDALGLETIDTYDALHRVVLSEIRKEKIFHRSEKKYNQNGKLVRQIDTSFSPDGHSRKVVICWEYDSMGRLSRLIEAEDTLERKVTEHSYTKRGEKKSTKKPDGVILQYEYNGLGHLISIQSSDGTVSHKMSYDRLGRLKSDDLIQRQLDTRGYLVSETFPSGYTIENAYNSVHQRIACIIPLADCRIEYAYLGADLLRVSRQTLAGQTLYDHEYVRRDLLGNLLEARLPYQVGNISQTFDVCSRKKSIEAPNFSQNVLSSDVLGNIYHMKINETESRFTYDALYQITSEKGLFDHDYQFDSLKCRLKKDAQDYEINALNQVVSHIEYDLNGNPKRKGGTQYVFDALDRLIRVETPSIIDQYTYDSQHRRLSTTTYENGFYKKYYFLYDGQKEIGMIDEDRIVQEFRVLGEAAHAEIGASIGIELYGETYVPIHDLSCNIAALISVESLRARQMRYSAFGEEKGSKFCPWRFSSKRTDETGLVYYGRRFYQSDLGRWLSPDPAGFTDGMNLYAFVGNSPLTHFDEYGLFQASSRGSTPATNQKATVSAGMTSVKEWFESPKTDYFFRHGLRTNLPLAPISWAYSYYQWDKNSSPQSHIYPSINPGSKRAKAYYPNGILNTPQDNFKGCNALNRALGGDANVIPAYSESFGALNDLLSVSNSLSQNDYSTKYIRMLKNEVETAIQDMERSGDPEKIFMFPFSRGTTDVYHAVKDFTRPMKDRLIIIACGGIKMLPRDLGFKVINLVSEGDWCSLHYNKELKNNPHAYTDFADVYLLEQQDGFSGFNKDHFFLSKTYQEGIKKYGKDLYDEYGNNK